MHKWFVEFGPLLTTSQRCSTGEFPLCNVQQKKKQFSENQIIFICKWQNSSLDYFAMIV